MTHFPATEAPTMLERVESDGVLLAIIVRREFREPGIHFFTPNDWSQQMGYMRHPAGKVIEPHVHNHIERAVKLTLEVLFIRSGRLRVDFYTGEKRYLESYELRGGDVILLASGGHGFEALEDVEMIEVKQGPYAGDRDKTRFQGITASQVKLHA